MLSHRGHSIASPAWSSPILRRTLHAGQKMIMGMWLCLVRSKPPDHTGEQCSVRTNCVLAELRGAIAGSILGPLGWLIIVISPNIRPTCPFSKGYIVEGAQKCKSCCSNILPYECILYALFVQKSCRAWMSSSKRSVRPPTTLLH